MVGSKARATVERLGACPNVRPGASGREPLHPDRETRKSSQTGKGFQEHALSPQVKQLWHPLSRDEEHAIV
jgi:hypothetical protein